MRFQCQTGCTVCCERKGFVYLTEEDVTRAAAFLRMSRAAFERKYIYRTKNLRRLRTPRDAQCYFLRDGGCSIHPAKPTQCRIFPFWPELMDSERKWHQTARYCPGIGKGDLGQSEDAAAQAREMRAAYPQMYSK